VGMKGWEGEGDMESRGEGIGGDDEKGDEE
jgi:hypothetical protein